MIAGAIAKRTVTALSVAAAVAAAIWYAPPCAVAAALAAVGIAAVAESATLAARRLDGRLAPSFTVAAVCAAAIAAAMLVLWKIESGFGGRMLLFTIAIVKISDMGGFAFGIAFGRHKLCPSISPNKSWEGLAGSVFASVLIASCFMPMTGFSFARSAGAGVAAAILGTAGDLLESKFKRWAGVKDSSVLPFTNGMGGILDMIDSLLLAPAAIWWFFLR